MASDHSILAALGSTLVIELRQIVPGGRARVSTDLYASASE